jgi:hypothetical protein
MKQEGHGCQKFPFREECSEDLSAVPCVLGENARYDGEFVCVIKTKFIITWCI